MTTSNQSYGVNVKDLRTCNIFTKLDENQDSGIASKDSEPSLSFLYTRESDNIGAAIEGTQSSLAKAFEKKKPKRKWESSRALGKDARRYVIEDDESDFRRDEDAILDLYKHDPKVQNPLYTTTANDIGLKKPSKATHTTTMYARSQCFSKSFNRIMFQDQGLNTSLTRSNVHERLDHFV